MAAQDAGMLHRFVTGYYWRGGAARVPALLGAVPKSWRERVDRDLQRRCHPQIDPSLVSTIPQFHALARVVAATERVAPALRRCHGAKWAEVWADWAFDRAVGAWLRRQPSVSIVHAFEGAALHTFGAAREIGAAAVLDVPSAFEYFIQEARDDGERFDPHWLRLVSSAVRARRREADWLFVPSAYVRRCLLENGVPGTRIVHIPYGADPERFQPNVERARAPNAPFRVLFVGRVGARKGVRYLLEAWRALELPNAELVLTGGADRGGLELLDSHAGISRWTGNVPWPVVHELFQHADVFAFPSLAEGSALVTYEAMAAGLPVVTTSNAGSVVRDGVDGFIVPPRDAAAVAERIRWLYEHPGERAAMGARARQHILERYTWQHYRARVACAYRAIHARRPVQDALDELEANWPADIGLSTQ